MANSNINIRVDEDLKRRFEEFCDEIGMSVTTAMTVFMKAAVRKNRIPFELEGDPFYCDANMAFMREGIAALNAGKGVEHELIEDDE